MGNYIKELTPNLKDRAINILSTLKRNKELSKKQRKDAIAIIDIIVHKSPKFFDENDQLSENSLNVDISIPEQITHSILVKMVEWDAKARVLSPKELLYVSDFAYGNKKLNSFHENNLFRLYQNLLIAGFDKNCS